MNDQVDDDGILGEKDVMHIAARQQNLDHFCLSIKPFHDCNLLGQLRTESRYGPQGDGQSIDIIYPHGNHVALKGPN